MIVYNLKFGGIPSSAVRIDRGTPWGNPFIIGLDGDREYVCTMFEQYAKWRLSVEPKWLHALRGKGLACWCEPLRCHGRTLIRLANG